MLENIPPRVDVASVTRPWGCFGSYSCGRSCGHSTLISERIKNEIDLAVGDAGKGADPFVEHRGQKLSRRTAMP